jgi:glucan 1,3-beta-glucosidase
MAWGLRVKSSEQVHLYGAGIYNFFQGYDQQCLQNEYCQDGVVNIEGENSSLYIYNLNTKAANSQISLDGVGLVSQADNRNGFCSTVTGFFA